jgi:hypothetical protein
VSQVKNLGLGQAVSAAVGQAAQAAAEASVRQLIANGKCKTALENAKENHKALGTPASEALLVDAYAARIETLLQQNLALEAQSLIELVRQRYPAARARLEGIGAAVAARSGALDTVVAPLADPHLSVELRADIDKVVRREIHDLAALASCPTLPPEHPLRLAAAALDRAFAAVTSGPVSNDVIALAEVSHRSPLAPWKLLVRAIASFYRHEDVVCREQLEAISPDSAAAPLVPAIHAMLGVKSGGEALTTSASALVSQTTADLPALRKALSDLERLIANASDGAILRAVRTAVQECRKNAPEQLERVKQHIFVRCAVEGMGRKEVISALGNPCREDASFFRLLARGLEQSGDPEDASLACGIWDEFRKAAVREGWFAANGREAATLYLHMAGLLRRLPKELQRDLENAAGRRNKGGPGDMYFISAEELYRRACTLDPHPEAFSEWFKWAYGNSQRQAESVAEAWHKIRPTDIDPILHLMDGADQFGKGLVAHIREPQVLHSHGSNIAGEHQTPSIRHPSGRISHRGRSSGADRSREETAAAKSQRLPDPPAWRDRAVCYLARNEGRQGAKSRGLGREQVYTHNTASLNPAEGGRDFRTCGSDCSFPRRNMSSAVRKRIAVSTRS